MVDLDEEELNEEEIMRLMQDNGGLVVDKGDKDDLDVGDAAAHAERSKVRNKERRKQREAEEAIRKAEEEQMSKDYLRMGGI